MDTILPFRPAGSHLVERTDGTTGRETIHGSASRTDRPTLARPDLAFSVQDLSPPGSADGADVVPFRPGQPGRAGEHLTLSEIDGEFRLIRWDGAEARVPRGGSAEDLVGAMRAVAAQPAPAADGCELSGREVVVLRLIAEGYSNKEIASQMIISVKTVETYKARSFEKLGLRHRVDLVRYAARRGWLAGL